MDVSESELAELKESKELHEAWAAFRLEHQETIQNDLSEEEYAWLARAIPQAIKPTVLHTAAALWKQFKVSGDKIKEHKKAKIVLLRRIVESKKRVRSLEIKILKMLFPKSKKLKGRTLRVSDIDTYIGRQKGLKLSGSKNAKKNAKKNLKKLNKIQAEIRKKTRLLTLWRDLVAKENEKISKLERKDKGKKSRARLLVAHRWAAFRAEHQGTIENHLSDEEYAWLEQEFLQAVKPIGFSALKWFKIKQLEMEISIITKEIRPLRKTILEAIDAPESRKEVKTGDFKRYVDSQRRRYLKNVNSYEDRINAATARANIEIIRKKINKLGSLLFTRSDFRKQLKELKATNADTERKKRTEARLLTAQEEKDVIFW